MAFQWNPIKAWMEILQDQRIVDMLWHFSYVFAFYLFVNFLVYLAFIFGRKRKIARERAERRAIRVHYRPSADEVQIEMTPMNGSGSSPPTAAAPGEVRLLLRDYNDVPVAPAAVERVDETATGAGEAKTDSAATQAPEKTEEKAASEAEDRQEEASLSDDSDDTIVPDGVNFVNVNFDEKVLVEDEGFVNEAYAHEE